jgi:hypothetical protein
MTSATLFSTLAAESFIGRETTSLRRNAYALGDV